MGVQFYEGKEHLATSTTPLWMFCRWWERRVARWRTRTACWCTCCMIISWPRSRWRLLRTSRMLWLWYNQLPWAVSWMFNWLAFIWYLHPEGLAPGSPSRAVEYSKAIWWGAEDGRVIDFVPIYPLHMKAWDSSREYLNVRFTHERWILKIEVDRLTGCTHITSVNTSLLDASSLYSEHTQSLLSTLVFKMHLCPQCSKKFKDIAMRQVYAYCHSSHNSHHRRFPVPPSFSTPQSPSCRPHVHIRRQNGNNPHETDPMYVPFWTLPSLRSPLITVWRNQEWPKHPSRKERQLKR